MTDPHKIFTDFELKQIATMKNRAASAMKETLYLKDTFLAGGTLYLKDTFLAGGCFASFALVENPKDYDVFLTNEDAKRALINHVTPDKYIINADPSYWNNTMIEKTILNTKTKVQYILTKFKTRCEVIDHFDMLHCCVSYVPHEDKLYISKKVIEAINQRKIISNGEKKIASWREQKMILRGWSV
jgi:hypothetical protein